MWVVATQWVEGPNEKEKHERIEIKMNAERVGMNMQKRFSLDFPIIEKET